MSKGYTLRRLLPVVDTTLSRLYTIELVSAKGIKLIFHKFTPNAVTVTCMRPEKQRRCGVFGLNCQEPWHELGKIFHLRMDVPCWSVHETTFANIDSIIAKLDAVKNTWAPFKEENNEKEDAA